MKKWLSIAVLSTLVFSACGPQSYMPKYEGRLTEEVLQESLDLAEEYLVNVQKEEGNFHYQYDFLEGSLSEEDSQVRQAGTLWSLSLIHLEQPSTETQAAIEKGLDFFIENSPNGYIVYPGETQGKTGTMALTSLALIDYLRSEPETENLAPYEAQLEAYLEFLMSLQTKSHRFHKGYSTFDGSPIVGDSPYFDGETLLALTKAAKYLGYTEYKKEIHLAAEAMYRDHVWETQILEKYDTLKGFAHWGLMAYGELHDSPWKKQDYADWSYDIADYLVDEDKFHGRQINSGYAIEGVSSAYEIAYQQREKARVLSYQEAIDKALYRGITWQVGHSHQSDYLRSHLTEDPLAYGGTLSKGNQAVLRIDYTQHHAHAVIKAMKALYHL